MNCLGERALFSSLFGIVSSQFFPSNKLIIPYNIRYWWFFLSKGNRWIKYCAHPKIRRSKPYQLKFVFLFALDGFHPLLSAQLTTDLTLECSNGSMFHPLSHTAWENPFYCAETAHNSIGIELLWFNGEKLGDMVFGCSFVGQIFSIMEVLQSPKQMIIRRCKVRAIRWMHQSFPTKFRQFLASHQRCVWPGVVVVEQNALSIDQFWALLLNCFL